MTTESPEKTKESEKSADGLTDQQFEQVKNNEISVDDLSKEQNNQLRQRLLDEKEPKDPAEEPAIEPEKKEPEEEPVKKRGEGEKSEKSADKPEKKKNWRENLKREADETNRIEQKLKSLKIRREKAREEYDKLKDKKHEVKGYDDLDFDEKEFVKETRLGLARLKEENQFLLSQIAGRDQEDASEYMGQLEDAQSRKTFAAINNIQEVMPDLKTKTAFKTLDRDWLRFQDTLVELSGLDADKLKLTEEEKGQKGVVQAKLREAALKKYDTNKAFHKDASEFVPESLKDDDEMEKYALICEANALTQRIGGTIKGNLLDILDGEGTLSKSSEKKLKKTALEASKKTAEAIEKKSPETLNPSDGPGTGPTEEAEMTKERATNIIGKLAAKKQTGVNLTPEEGKLNKAARMFLLEQEGNQ